MATLKEELIKREQEAGPFRIGLVGAGQMGTGMISQIEKMHGLKIVAVSDVMPTRAKDAYGEASVDLDLVHWEEDDVAKADQLIREGQRVATHSSDFLVKIPRCHCGMHGHPNISAMICNQAIEAGKPIINMNVETCYDWLLPHEESP